jgi:peptidoglycan hydrolase CwlO-like protein
MIGAGVGAIFAHWQTRRKVDAEVESTNLDQAEKIRAKWQELYEEMGERVTSMEVSLTAMRARITELESELHEEKKRTRELEHKLENAENEISKSKK